MTFNWDVNIPVVLALLGAVATVIGYTMAALNRIEAAKRLALEAKDAAKSASDAADRVQANLSILQGNIAAYREIQAERLVSREVLREVEERLVKAVESVALRLDSLFREFMEMVSNLRRPP